MKTRPSRWILQAATTLIPLLVLLGPLGPVASGVARLALGMRVDVAHIDEHIEKIQKVLF